MIYVIDFGGQTAHLITRRLKDLGVESLLIDPAKALKIIEKRKPAGIIFSGGPASVYEIGAPSIDKKIFDLEIPILGICYGWQLMAHLLGGEVESGNKEYGPTILTISGFDSIFYGLPNFTKVIESHGDTVKKMPAGFVSGLKKICEAQQVLLIADEVATGYCRTASMFAVDQERVVR
jgi:GMP synthase (glutamine-hydrolysing)